jgi:hypothetical protein
MGGRLARWWRFYAVWQALLVVLSLVLPAGGFARVLVQVAVGWSGAAYLFVCARRMGERQALVWQLFALGLLLNSSGLLVEYSLLAAYPQITSPHLADLFWLSLYPCYLAGLGILVYRGTARDEAGGLGMVLGTVVSTVLTAGLGLFAWELIIVPQTVDRGLPRVARLMITAYPSADLMMVALVLRSLLGRDRLYPAFRLLLASIFCFLAADVGWAYLSQQDASSFLPVPLPVLLQTFSLSAYALSGAAAVHPSAAEVVQPARAQRPRMALAVAGSLAISLLIAPVTLAVQMIIDLG